MKFSEIIERISNKSPLQKKRLVGYLSTRDEVFVKEADDFIDRYERFLSKHGISIEYALDAYLKMCSDMLRCQVAFSRTGRYPVDSVEDANRSVYAEESEMMSYMVGLGISQFLWPTHYSMFSFFRESIEEVAESIESYLEIGPGHGLLLEHAIGSCPSLSKISAIDISPTSLELAKSVIKFFNPSQSNIEFLLGDVTVMDIADRFEFITMGEVLEHVEQPETLLIRVRELLATKGRAFISTCANCPAIDHVYQFNSVEEIRDMIYKSGLKIISDLPLPVENMSVEEAEANRITVNYCALLEA